MLILLSLLLEEKNHEDDDDDVVVNEPPPRRERDEINETLEADETQGKHPSRSIASTQAFARSLSSFHSRS